MAATKARDLTLREREWIKKFFEEGFEAANAAFEFTDAQAKDILGVAGFEAGQIDLISQLPGLAAASIIDPTNLPQPLRDLQQQASQAGDRSFDIFLRGGQTDDTSFQRDRLGEFQRGATQAQQQQLDIGGRLVQSEGRTAATINLTDRGNDLINSGGLAGAPGLEEAQKNALAALGREDPGLARIRDAGMALVSSGGFTPELRQLLGQATNLLSVVGTGGMTPQLQQVFDNAIKIVNSGGAGGALLPFDQVLQNAREEAAFAINSQVERSVREASARGGFQGGLVAGAAASPLAEFADQAAEMSASAVRSASESQQKLQLQQLETAFGASGAAAAAGAQRESQLASIGAGLAGDVSRSASANLGTGGSMALGAQQAEVQRQNQVRGQIIDIGSVLTQRQQLGANMVNQAGTLELGRLNQGSNMLQTATQQQLQASELLNNLSAIEASRESMGLQGFQNGINSQLNILNSGTAIQQANFQNMLAQMSFQESLRQQDINNQLASLGIIQGNGNAMLDFSQNAMNNSTQLTLGAGQFQAQPGIFASTILPALISGGITAASGGTLFGGAGGSAGGALPTAAWNGG